MFFVWWNIWVFIITSGCPWPKATVKSPWVPVTFGHCFLFFLIFYSLFFTALDALPLPCHAPALPCPALFRIFLLLPGTGGGSYTGNGQCLFFLLLSGTGGGSYTGNGQCFFFPLLPRTGGGSYTLPIASSSFSSPVGGSAPLDSVTVEGGVRFDGSLVAGMDETSVRLDEWRFERAESGVASFTSPKIHWDGIRGCFTKSLHI